MEILSVVGRNVNSFYFIIIIIYLDERESKVYKREEIATLLFFSLFSLRFHQRLRRLFWATRTRRRKKSCKFSFLHNFEIFTSCRERTL